MKKGISRRDFLKGTAAGALGMGIANVVGCSSSPAATTAKTSQAASTAASAENNTATAAAGGSQTASATAPGFGGDVTVTLTVDTETGKITDCQIIGDNETAGVGGRAVAQMPELYINAGSLEVDGISGATMTSTAIKQAAQSAYNSAMGSGGSAVHMKAGQYTAGALGYWGIWELPVTITVNETALLKIEVPEDRFAHGESEVILQSVKDKMFPRILESQSLRVDSISGATATSSAVKTAVAAALKEALAEGGSEENAIDFFYQEPAKPETAEPKEIETDILVVGLGNGGMIAFRRAVEEMQKRNGSKLCSILAIDKGGKVGGKSSLTHEFNAVNPPKYMAMFNEGKDYVDAENYLNMWLEFTTGADGKQKAKENMIRLFCQESGNMIDWLYESGWRFGTMVPSPMAGGCVSYNSVLASNTDTGTYEDRRKGVNKFYQAFLSYVEAQGGSYMLETEGYEILTEGSRVTGVRARNLVTGQEYLIHCKALIMNTGGFGANDEMLTRLLDPKWAGPRKRLGVGLDDGKMFQAALDIGAGTWNVEMCPMVMHVGLDHYLSKYPIHKLEGTLDGRTGRTKTWTLNDIPLGMGISSDSLAVTPEGRRFDNEENLIRFAKDIYGDSWCSYQAGLHYYSIYSKEQMEELAEKGFTCIKKWEGYCWQGGVPDETPIPEVFECLDACVDEGMAFKGDTLADLAKALGMETKVLEETVNTYNGYADAGEDAEFGKNPEYLKKIGSGPYYAIEIKNVIFGTCGGLDVDENIRVLQKDHETPIDGLYALGLDSMGVLMSPEHNYNGFGGVAQGWLATSGYLAAAHAVNYVAENFGLTEVSPALVDLEAVSSAR